MKTTLALLAALAAVCAQAQPLPKADIPLERYYQYPLINGRSPAGATMSPDGRFIVFGWNETGERKLDVWVMEYPSATSAVSWMPARSRRYVSRSGNRDARHRGSTRVRRRGPCVDGGPGGSLG